jgi:3-oxoacyl-[acyl-carrier protein] reductase
VDLKLKGKKAIVLGGTRGIGRKIAETLADEGVDVAICARGADAIPEAVAALEAKGVKAFGAGVDIADGEGLKAWVSSAGKDLGGIDILISNASGMTQGGDAESWRTCLEIDVLGVLNAFEAAEPFLSEAAEKNGDAAVISIGSVSSINSAEVGAYGAMKAALIHAIKGMAKKHAPRHIRANVVSPGTVYFKGGVWHMIEENMPDMFKATMARNPMGRMATPADIADATVFLASPRSSFTTGINMIVDGTISDRANF